MDLTDHNAYKLYVGLASLAHSSEPYMHFDGADERIRKHRMCQGMCATNESGDQFIGIMSANQLKEPTGLNKRINILNKRLGLPERWVVMYAVVREEVDMKSFGKWHQTEVEATEEATRLCRKERKSFIIVKAIKRLSVPDVPVKVEEITE